MVYGGKPSRGCRTCRARRIKCDEGKPTCKQCAKSKRECGGYRSEFEIVHRDQTTTTVRRVRKALELERRPPAAPATTGFTFVHEQPEEFFRQQSQGRQWHRPHNSSPPPVVTMPLAQRAACYFASNFILCPLTSTPHGYFDYLIPLLESAPADSALNHAFNACAFAAFGNRVKSASVDFSGLSLKAHTLALTTTHLALGNAAKANTNSTLAAVLLLSLYESITAVKNAQMLTWKSHVDGAAHIVKARGRAQMCQTKTGALLFNAVRHQLISRSLSSGKAPPLGADWWVDDDDATDSVFTTAEGFALKTSELCVEVSRFAANRPLDFVRQMIDMAKRVHAVDHDIAAWEAHIPSEFRPRTLCWVPAADTAPRAATAYAEMEVFPGRVDIYPDFVTAAAWNMGRVSRLILESLRVRITAWLCSPTDYRTTAEYARSKEVCEDIISDIIASVPYHLGWHTRRRELFENESERSGFACGEDKPVKALPALLLMWSLTTVKNNDMTSEAQRAWAKGRLSLISDHVGIKNAGVLNQFPFRFPSMMIRQDGLMSSPDPLQDPVGAGVIKRQSDTSSESAPRGESLASS
ncbi:hypothetical protein B0H67DRAFT_591955 [Lasiosphaeris hirsuta]|uniref:Zn(2)-C6 fungal-type domain-containing protein n=1 Tax=Lasiosphaeris hirsuta TaxID=260670 RepID=A0AA39ZVT8_9PEZI|nr:hypothetical protein B0H67DRAFT_591955 [Lasiosphaeris hirsuta]